MSNGGQFSGIGFAPGVVTGARSFDVDPLGRLTGVTFKQVWRPGENEAECRKSEQTGGLLFGSIWSVNIGYYTGSAAPQKVTVKAKVEPPHTFETCACGFYAYYDGSNDYHARGRASAVIEGYGETIIGTRGFRTMKARIIALRINNSVDERLARMIARNYPNVPLFDSFKRMVSEFQPDAAGMEVTPTSDPDFWSRSI